MIVLVCGGRDYADEYTVFSLLDAVHADYGIDLLIHGNAYGADSLADQWAIERNILCKAYTADWKKYGRGAGPIRNKQMLDEGKPDLVVAFPGGKGTANMVKLAQKAKIATISLIEEPDRNKVNYEV